MEGTPIPSNLAGRYEIRRLIGRGGMAAVYLARDVKHDRDVAVKILEPELTHSLGSERFLREIRIAAQLTHPNILPLHDSGEADGLLYYVMPFVTGESLRDRLDRERQLPVADALRITCQVAAALEHAHRKGLLHRDIKPENILLEDGRALLADFGIARGLDGAVAARLTATGLALGTPVYMSPEQAAADPRVDARSDIYSLASVLHEMLAGEPPFTGPSAQSILAKRMTAQPPRIRDVRPSVPEPLEQVLLRALDRVPADRFASAAEFAAALEACSTAAARPRRSRRPLITAMTVAVLLVLAAAGVGLADRLRPEVTTTVAVLPLTNASADPEHAYLADGLTDAVIADLLNVPGVRVISRSSVMRFAAGMAMTGEMGTGGGMGSAAQGAQTQTMARPMERPMDSMEGMEPSMEPMERAGAVAAEAPAMGGAATAEMAAMTRPRSLGEIARELRADLLVQGSLTRTGDSVRVAASLIRPDPLEQIWDGSYTRHIDQLSLLQQELTLTVAHAAARGRKSGATRAGHPRTYDPRAHDAFLKGSYFQAHWRLPQAIAAFENAIAIDRRHAPAHVGLARAYYFLAFFGEVSPSVALGAMRRAATAALESDSLYAEAHGQMALVKMLQEWDWDGAERHFRRALELSPGNAQIRHDYAHFLLAMGKRRDSWEQTRRAVALDPANPMLISCLGWHSLFDGQHEQALAHAAEAHAMMPDDWAKVVMGWALLGQGKDDEAVAAFRDAVALSDGAFALAALAHGLAAAGLGDEARQVLDRLLARAEHEYVSPYDIASVYAGLDDGDAALRWLRRAADERSTFIVHLGWDSRFSNIRSHPRFAELTEREMRLPARLLAAVSAAERGRM
jgi:TolB-like protein/tRNA A-37 threonylcarbamoyl transferase component Bud32/Flp pilus assembly protein TadD